MRKLFIIFISIILLTAIAVFNYKITKKTPQVQTEHHYLFSNVMDSYYDLNTFKYDALKNRYSIDLFFNPFPGGDDVISYPFDDVSSVQYIIVEIVIYKNIEDVKIDMEYKGFVTGHLDETNGEYFLNDVKLHYDSDINLVPEIKEHFASLQENRYTDDNEKEFSKEITEIIYNAYKEGKLYEIKGVINFLNPMQASI